MNYSIIKIISYSWHNTVKIVFCSFRLITTEISKRLILNWLSSNQRKNYIQLLWNHNVLFIFIEKIPPRKIKLIDVNINSRRDGFLYSWNVISLKNSQKSSRYYTISRYLWSSIAYSQVMLMYIQGCIIYIKFQVHFVQNNNLHQNRLRKMNWTTGL